MPTRDYTIQHFVVVFFVLMHLAPSAGQQMEKQTQSFEWFFHAKHISGVMPSTWFASEMLLNGNSENCFCSKQFSTENDSHYLWRVVSIGHQFCIRVKSSTKILSLGIPSLDNWLEICHLGDSTTSSCSYGVIEKFTLIAFCINFLSFLSRSTWFLSFCSTLEEFLPKGSSWNRLIVIDVFFDITWGRSTHVVVKMLNNFFLFFLFTSWGRISKWANVTQNYIIAGVHQSYGTAQQNNKESKCVKRNILFILIINHFWLCVMFSFGKQ